MSLTTIRLFLSTERPSKSRNQTFYQRTLCIKILGENESTVPLKNSRFQDHRTKKGVASVEIDVAQQKTCFRSQSASQFLDPLIFDKKGECKNKRKDPNTRRSFCIRSRTCLRYGKLSGSWSRQHVMTTRKNESSDGRIRWKLDLIETTEGRETQSLVTWNYRTLQESSLPHV